MPPSIHRANQKAWRSDHRVCACIVLAIFLGAVEVASAGMPAILPTGWTAENSGRFGPARYDPIIDRLFQGISFFGVCFLATAAGVRWTWNYLRRDIQRLPYLSYGRAVALTVLWGFLFVVVLTMISGARELMTPGAWQKQGWTYSLDSAASTSLEDDSEGARRSALESLRFQLWNYAATHDGQFPAASRSNDESTGETTYQSDKPDSEVIPSASWKIPGWPGLTFQYVDGQSVGDAGSVLVFEPSLERDQRLVLLTNGVVGKIPVEELKRFLRTHSTERESQKADLPETQPVGDQP